MLLKKQKIIIIDGPMGAGKTTVDDLLHNKLKKSIVTGICRMKHHVSGFAANKQEYKITTAALLAMCKCYLDYGKTIIVEQSFVSKSIIRPHLDLARQRKLPCLIYELYAPKKILLQRIRQRPRHPIPQNRISHQKILKNISNYPHRPYAPIRLSFDSSRLSARQIVNRIIPDLK